MAQKAAGRWARCGPVLISCTDFCTDWRKNSPHDTHLGMISAVIGIALACVCWVPAPPKPSHPRVEDALLKREQVRTPRSTNQHTHSNSNPPGRGRFLKSTRVSGERPLGTTSSRQQSIQASCQPQPPPGPLNGLVGGGGGSGRQAQNAPSALCWCDGLYLSLCLSLPLCRTFAVSVKTSAASGWLGIARQNTCRTWPSGCMTSASGVWGRGCRAPRCWGRKPQPPAHSEGGWGAGPTCPGGKGRGAMDWGDGSRAVRQDPDLGFFPSGTGMTDGAPLAGNRWRLAGNRWRLAGNLEHSVLSV